jgi:hypothetical protein
MDKVTGSGTAEVSDRRMKRGGRRAPGCVRNPQEGRGAVVGNKDGRLLGQGDTRRPRALRDISSWPF